MSKMPLIHTCITKINKCKYKYLRQGYLCAMLIKFGVVELDDVVVFSWITFLKNTMCWCFTFPFYAVPNRISRTERSGRYGSDQPRDESEWRDRRERDPEREHNMRRWGEERRTDRYEGGGERRASRDSPEVAILICPDYKIYLCSWRTLWCNWCIDLICFKAKGP